MFRFESWNLNFFRSFLLIKSPNSCKLNGSDQLIVNPIASAVNESFVRVHCLNTLMRKGEINVSSLLKGAVKCVAVFSVKLRRVTAERLFGKLYKEKYESSFLMLKLVGFLCGKYLKTVWCVWLLCVAVTEKLECT